GFRWDYTGATGRLPRLLLEKELRLWSLPDTLRLRINPGNAPVKQVVFSLYAGDGKLNSVTAVPDTVIADQPLTLDLPTAQWTPADDMGSYPITLSAIQLDLNAMTSGEPYHLEINGLETVYARVPDTPAVPGDADGNGITDIDDVNLVINIMVGRTPATDAADVNGSGNIDIDDLNLVINVMLGKYRP
ncbi:MAG: dockerin type I repeat-containing protein, partial [Muribaculaceae bacterium]|nr:dockerin type I repeat-containing protein [Muribaculaceae bacterium]